MTASRDYLGTYRLVRMVRAGQTCQIWEAIRDLDQQRVALKVLQPELRNDRVEIAYLRHEYEVAKDFDHEDVIEVYEYCSDRDIPFLVMEYNGGKNLKMALRYDRELLDYHMISAIRQSAQGLLYMHQKGWVHRDVKPDNFLFTSDGDVKIIDFALAQRVKSGLGKLLAGKSKFVAGTRSYMAPEQIRGQPLDFRADIYSFGCMLFELMTGRTPYTGSSPQDLLMKHLRAAVPAAVTMNKNVTLDFSDMIMRLMAKEPEDRPQKMDDFLQEYHRVRVFKVTPKAPASLSAGSGEE